MALSMENVSSIIQNEPDKMFWLSTGKNAVFIDSVQQQVLADEFGKILVHKHGMKRVPILINLFMFTGFHSRFWTWGGKTLEVGVYEWIGFTVKSRDRSILEKIQPDLESLIDTLFPRKA